MSNLCNICKDIITNTTMEIQPGVTVSNVESHLVGKCKMTKCPNHCNQPSYYVDQLIHVRSLISYSATVIANVTPISCCDSNEMNDIKPSPCPQSVCRKRNRSNRFGRTCLCILCLYLGLPLIR